MTPQEHEQAPSFELPPAQPSAEQANQAQAEQQQVARTETQSAVSVEQGVSQSPPPIPPQQQSAQQSPAAPVPPPNASQAPAGSIAGGWMPQIADDADLIEKEWVTKAKEIVARTAHDPHLQNKEMTRFKADYLKKRYNKDIKLSEDT